MKMKDNIFLVTMILMLITLELHFRQIFINFRHVSINFLQTYSTHPLYVTLIDLSLIDDQFTHFETSFSAFVTNNLVVACSLTFALTNKKKMRCNDLTLG